MVIWEALRTCLAEQQPAALLTVLDGDAIGAKLLLRPEQPALGSLGDTELDRNAARDALALLDQERSESRAYDVNGAEVTVLIETFPPPAHLIIVGAVHTGIPLATCAKQLGFRVTVVDPRAAFATPERFPHADELIVEWPDEALPRLRLDRSTYVVVLTHDPKLDDPAVRTALAHPVRYVGAIGSAKTQAKRREKLRDDGVAEADLQRIHGPVGLALGSKTPGEIAISILAEMIAVRRGQRDGATG